jgi:ketosteroid isomerase-like protein
MTATSNEALKVALAYFQAMANKDVDGIMTLVDDNIACFNPVGDFEGSERFRAFEEGFARMIEKLTLVTAFGDEKQAVIVYACDTLPVKNSHVAEHLTVEAGKITSNRVIYDAAPYAAYMASLPKH